ncbi:restriction endonuclease subunit S [Butyrivibrio sp. INlla14]|uniref:restriction endonuclease subunit S n=1 Tax=Butyrivibrio sp. INlla14 TaxID=1520808 RepID=UPI000876B034|nr:restriction endonuclease subunit S [Butyrivibrio sp. INlla14]SCY14055.1 type I restriction enzyme, S subunit [Butyrivibrio sp. INlla14]
MADKKPQIRFTGFTDDWEQRKLGEVAAYRNGKAHENDVTDNGKYVIVNSKFVSTNGEVKKFSDSQIEPLHKDEIAFVLSDVPNGRAIARTFLIDKDDKYTLNQRIAGITPKEETDAYFLYILMNRNPYFLRFDDGNKQTNLSVNDVMQFEAAYPSFREQHKIGELFKTVDDAITLHQRKYDKLKNIKKSMLEKMFPKNGAKKPEIRFAGFTDDWEQRKFSDVVDIGSGMDYKHLGEGDIPVYGTGGYMLSVDAALSEDKDAIGIGRKGTIDKPYILRAPFWTVDTLFYCIPKDGYDLDFTSCLFQNVDWKKKDESTGVPSLSKVIINNVETAAPSYDEQRKIGDYFKGIDNLITLHQRKLEKLQNIKKSMLEKMFV